MAPWTHNASAYQNNVIMIVKCTIDDATNFSRPIFQGRGQRALIDIIGTSELPSDFRYVASFRNRGDWGPKLLSPPINVWGGAVEISESFFRSCST